MALYTIDDQYGDTERGRQLRARVIRTANRYVANIAQRIGTDANGAFDPAFGRKSYQKVSRRVYMGLANG